MSESPLLEELRLSAFKSFQGAALPLRDLTLLIGRNGSGKSNAIDGLQVLANLAEGEDIRDAIDGGRRDGPEVRGGARGCVPFGEDRFAVGCRVGAGNEVFDLDVVIQVEPDVQIIEECLRVQEGDEGRNLLTTDAPDPERADILARYDNGKRGLNPALPFRSTRLLTAQVPARVPAGTKAMQRVHRGAEAVVEALRAVFVLDPVPSLMRQYVPARDSLLRRQADNLSAAVGALRSDPETWARLRELVQSLPEQRVDEISLQSSPLGDVIIALEERLGRKAVPVSARVVSDGMLRFVAFATALLGAPLLDQETEGGDEHTMLVIEEVENGLHPSQAARLVGLIKSESQRRRVRTLATTHSPPILTALPPEDHEGVVLCDRDADTGLSRLRRLVDVPAYTRAMAAGSLGDAITRGRFEDTAEGDGALRELDKILNG